MPILYESQRTGEHILAEANGTLSREQITLVAGVALPPGQVLGIVTASGHYTAYDNAATDGSQTAVAVLYAPASESATPRRAVAHVRHAEMQAALLTGLDANARADLLALQFILR